MNRRPIGLDKNRPIASIVNPLTYEIRGVEYSDSQVRLYDPYGTEAEYNITKRLLHETIEAGLWNILFYKDEIPEGGF